MIVEAKHTIEIKGLQFGVHIPFEYIGHFISVEMYVLNHVLFSRIKKPNRFNEP